MPSILFICTANQIRSPIAAGLFVAMLKKAGRQAGWRVESAGTWATEGLPANRTAQHIMQANGVDLSMHRTRCVTGVLLEGVDLILVMEEGHKEALQVEFPSVAPRVFLLAEMSGTTWDVADPSSAADDHDRVGETVRVILKLLTRGFDRICALAGAPPPTHVALR